MKSSSMKSLSMKRLDTLAYTYLDWQENGQTRYLGILYEMGETHTDSEWDEWLDFVGPLSRIDTQNFSLLVFSRGKGPTASQRKKSLQVIPDPTIPQAVVSHSKLVRGIVTAYSWWRSMNIHAFSNLEEAYEFLKIPKIKMALVDKLLVTLETGEIFGTKRKIG